MEFVNALMHGVVKQAPLNAQETERAAEAHEAAYLQQLKEVGELGFCTFENDEKRAGIL